MRLSTSTCFVWAIAAVAWGQFLPPAYVDAFEKAANTPESAWRGEKRAGEASFSTPKSGRDGGICLAIRTDGGDAAWRTSLPVSPRAVYRLTAWVWTEMVSPVQAEGTAPGAGAYVELPGLGGLRSTALTGTNEWSRLEVTFDTGSLEALDVALALGGDGLVTGSAYFDDLRLDRLSQDNLYPAVRLIGQETGPPISKYIYGQFIEHMGRAIQGGLWAELLDDRKFYHALGDPASPWRSVGSGVSTDTSRPYSGDHAITIALDAAEPRGIAQEGIALRAGMAYTGHLVAAGSAAVEVALIWGASPEERATATVAASGSDYTAYPFALSSAANTSAGRLEITATGGGILHIGTASLMPGDNVEGMRADVLALLKEIDAPVYRWPGGNFVSGYNWRDGIGPRDLRPPRKNPAWKGIEPNDFGVHEFMRLIELLGSEACVVVNSGLGTVDEAAAQLTYLVGEGNTEGGKLRASHGREAPFHVPFIGIGNEMYGDWQLGHMPLAEYVAKHRAVAEALRPVAPGARLIAVGAPGEWSDTMLRECAGHLDLISEHFYCGQRAELLSHAAQAREQVRTKAAAHRARLAALTNPPQPPIPLALDEWNYWHGPEVYGEAGVQYTLRDALGIAAALHAMYEASDVIGLANYAQAVNVLGAVKATPAAACLDTTGVVLALYRGQFGEIPIKLQGSAFPLDVAAAWTREKDAVTLSILNPTHEAYELGIGVEGMAFPSGGTRWVITGASAEAKNVPGQAPGVTVHEETLNKEPRLFPAPPLSASLFRLTTRPLE